MFRKYHKKFQLTDAQQPRERPSLGWPSPQISAHQIACTIYYCRYSTLLMVQTAMKKCLTIFSVIILQFVYHTDKGYSSLPTGFHEAKRQCELNSNKCVVCTGTLYANYKIGGVKNIMEANIQVHNVFVRTVRTYKPSENSFTVQDIRAARSTFSQDTLV